MKKITCQSLFIYWWKQLKKSKYISKAKILIRELKMEVIIVDDNSPDGTQDKVKGL
jgi:hypothetical protein